MARILTYDEYHEKLKSLKTTDDMHAFVKDLVAPVLQEMLEAEMTAHLGRRKYERTPDAGASGNLRNGHSAKTVQGQFGATELQVPRDRAGTFDPVAVKKYETVTSEIEERIVSMCAKGMTTRDIHAHMHAIYGVDVSAAMVSQITDKVPPLVRAWQDRPLASVYPVVYLDGIHFKLHEGGKIVTRCSYTVLGITPDGSKELLGIWVGAAESATFWLGILNELKNRGVADILICCVDGLTGFRDAIQAAFPEAAVQRCLVHQVRSTIRYVPYKHRKAFCADLRTIYTAPSEAAGFAALQAVKERWPTYCLRAEELGGDVARARHVLPVRPRDPPRHLHDERRREPPPPAPEGHEDDDDLPARGGAREAPLARAARPHGALGGVKGLEGGHGPVRDPLPEPDYPRLNVLLSYPQNEFTQKGGQPPTGEPGVTLEPSNLECRFLYPELEASQFVRGASRAEHFR